MSTAVDTLESLQEALNPLDGLQTEQAELGPWIHDSFAALEKLHAELTQWQSELARKETELDLRQDSLSETSATDKELQKQVAQLETQLASARGEIQQLEQAHGERLRAFAELEDRYGTLQDEHTASTDRLRELETALAVERERSAAESELWKKEFQSLRSDLETYFKLLTEQVEKLSAQSPLGQKPLTPLSAGAAHANGAELRRRAHSRRKAK